MVVPFVPTDGRLTSFQSLPFSLTGGEVMYVVSPGNAALGNSYQVTTETLALFMAAFPFLNTTVIKLGATLASPYLVEPTDTRILFNKTTPSATYAVLPLAASMAYPYPVLFKDLKGDAYTNNITITFAGGEKCEGQTEVVIENAYGWANINPIPGGGGWFLS